MRMADNYLKHGSSSRIGPLSFLNLFRLALIYVSLFNILKRSLFVYLRFVLYFWPLLITTTVFSRKFAGCCLRIVCDFVFTMFKRAKKGV